MTITVVMITKETWLQEHYPKTGACCMSKAKALSAKTDPSHVYKLSVTAEVMNQKEKTI